MLSSIDNNILIIAISHLNQLPLERMDQNAQLALTRLKTCPFNHVPIEIIHVQTNTRSPLFLADRASTKVRLVHSFSVYKCCTTHAVQYLSSRTRKISSSTWISIRVHVELACSILFSLYCNPAAEVSVIFNNASI